ncbi:MAG: hypothetical protein K6G26_09225 [Lachnospiraceae bacterium]|nr:hypothetical protein [Lachnospiraceae bacterium]
MKKRNLVIIFSCLFLACITCVSIISFAGGTKMPTDSVTIYYKGYDNPYIHYKIGDGDWTKVPGYALTKSSTMKGYPYIAKIDTKGEPLTCCFNDGNGTWDSCNGANYTLMPGTYTYSTGVITEVDATNENTLDCTVKTSGDPRKAAELIRVYINKFNNGKAPYYVSLSYQFDGEEVVTYKNNEECKYNDFSTTFMLTKGGPLNIWLSAHDSTGLTYTWHQVVNVEGFAILGVPTTPASPVTTGTEVNFSNCQITNVGVGFGAEYGSYPKYTIDITNMQTNETVSYPHTYYQRASWTPKKAGTYAIHVSAVDYYGQVATHDSTFVVTGEDIVDPKPQIYTEGASTIYYKGFDKPYIHYKIGDGDWSTVPGIPMTAAKDEVEGYDYKAVLPLSGAKNVTVCFNDGKGNWDSNNGENYTFKEGAWGFTSGKTTNLRPKTPTNNKVTIYYTGYITPNIHYCIDNDNWTKAPGIPMNSSTKYEGFDKEYTIDLGDAEGVSVCFNDGHSSWDSNYGKNYYFTAGSYYYSGGQITPVEE